MLILHLLSTGRSAKVKCDGKLPACTACEKAGRENECSAANDQFARGKERSYVAALELRVEKLERRLKHARLRKASVAFHDPDVPPSALPSTHNSGRRDSLDELTLMIRRKEARTRENSDVNALVSDFGTLSINATTRDFEPETANMTFARLVLAASANDPVPEPKDTEEELPARSMIDQIVEFYEANILSLYPLFEAVTIRRLVNRMYADEPEDLRSWEYWMFWMVLAIGSTAQSQSKDDDHYLNGVEFVARALTHADRALTPGYTSQIQSLTLLTLYSMLDPVHFDSWHLIGFTCRSVIDLGFHKDPAWAEKKVLDARRRLFYCVYALDRAISMVHARAFAFYDEAVSVGLPKSPPLSDGSIDPQRPPDPSVPLFKLRQLQSAWYQRLFQCDPNDVVPDSLSYIWQKCFAMRQWNDSLSSKLSASIREMFELELHYSYVFCIAPSAGAPNLTDYQRLLIFEHVIDYIDGIFGVAHASTNAAFYTYHDVLKVFFMGSQFVAVLRDAADSLLNGLPIQVPRTAPGIFPAPLPQRFGVAPDDHLDRSIRCLEKTSATLKRYGQRWQNALMLLESFEMISGPVVEDLRQRKEMRRSTPTQNQHMLISRPALPESQVQQSQYAPMGQPHPRMHAQQSSQDLRWADADVSRMIQRGGQI
ncbi:fungal-specific transcription factor domain-containing protein [Podospora fimiseda]|uniref:Fungal-specific transcription factor domain-containing protein n=1 Tax=Podospora fimiseda TaxID=252190 RepID=A0AAN6YPS2_9PEZI|nr:fungal-specific transcription factor domain-containing protein [Podospora fimiseda]